MADNGFNASIGYGISPAPVGPIPTVDPNQLSFTPVDHDPFQELADVANSTPNQGAPMGADTFMKDPNQPLAARLALAIPHSLWDQMYGLGQSAYSAFTLPGDVATGKVDPNSSEAIARSTNLAGFMTSPSLETTAANPDTLGIFAGAKAKTADLSALEQAKNLDDAGVAPHEILNNTGWFKGSDNNWRFEIPDNKATTHPDVLDYLRSSAQEQERTGPNVQSDILTGPTGKIFQHPELFKAYPQLADIPTTLSYNWEKHPNAEYIALKGSPRISMEANELLPNPTLPSGNLSQGSPIELALHELQHGVQHIEGFSPGSAPDSVVHMLDNNPYDAYLKTAGETEARNTVDRRNMTSGQRYQIPPWDTQDTPNAQQTVLGPWRQTPVDHHPFASPPQSASMAKPGASLMSPQDIQNIRQSVDPKWQNAPIIDSKGNTIHPGNSNPNAEHNYSIMMDDKGNPQTGFTAHHGSPFDFDKFDINKVDQQGGATQHGMGVMSTNDEPKGLFFAQSPESASQYIYETTQANSVPGYHYSTFIKGDPDKLPNLTKDNQSNFDTVDKTRDLYKGGTLGVKSPDYSLDPYYLGKDSHVYTLFHHDPVTILNKTKTTPIEGDPFNEDEWLASMGFSPDGEDIKPK